ncbi:LysR family transcriptional regulator [Ferrovibrio sp.]|uniref:LysR family transcriptional regulator n=1 Tax=Ferrovibrio sp. TaxID=1917215 RepID=UPI00351580A4
MSATALNWDDLRLVLAVAEHGTLSGAATTLGLSHPTLSRRLRLIEDRLGTRLFDRTPQACRPTTAGEEACGLARRLRDDIAGLERRIAGRDSAPAGPVRLTAPDAVAEYLLPPVLAAVCHENPALTFELQVSNQILSLAQRAADLALRVTDSPDPALKGRRIGDVAMAVYARQGLPASEADIAMAPWIGFDDALACSGPGTWITGHVPDASIRFRANTLLGAAQAVRSGIGCGILPCFVGGSIPGLAQVTPPLDGLTTGLWLLGHPDIARLPRIRSAGDALAAKLKGARALLGGIAA